MIELAASVAYQLSSHNPQLAVRFEQSLISLQERGWEQQQLRRYVRCCDALTKAGWHSWTVASAFIEFCEGVSQMPVAGNSQDEINRCLDAGDFGLGLAEIIHEPAVHYFSGLRLLLESDHLIFQQSWQDAALQLHERYPKHPSLLSDYFQASIRIIGLFDSGQFQFWIRLIVDSSTAPMNTFREILSLCNRPAQGTPYSTALGLPSQLRGVFLEHYDVMSHWPDTQLQQVGEILTNLGSRKALAADFIQSLHQQAKYLENESRTLILACCLLLSEPDNSPILEFVSVINQLPLHKPGQITAWVDKGVAFMEKGDAAGRAYYALESASGVDALHAIRGQVNFEDQQRLFSLYSEGITARRFQVQSVSTGQREFRDFSVASTDGKHIFLPEYVNLFDTPAENATFYKITLLHQLGFYESGTFEFEFSGSSTPFQTYFNSFEHPDLAARLFQLIEDARVDWYLLRRYKGMGRSMHWLMGEMLLHRSDPLLLRGPLARILEALVQFTLGASLTSLSDLDPLVKPILSSVEKLKSPGALVDDTMHVVDEVYPLLAAYYAARTIEPVEVAMDDELAELPGESGPSLKDWQPKPVDYRGTTDPGGVSLQSALDAWDDALAELLDNQLMDGSGTLIDPADVKIDEVVRGDMENAVGMMLTDIDVPVPAEDPTQGDSDNQEELQRQIQQLQAEFGKETGIYRYDEWDFEIGDYRKHWCKLHEMRVESEDMAVVDQILQDNQAIVTRIKRHFKTLRPELQRKVKGLLDGEDIDIEGAIEAVIDKRSGISPTEKIYIQRLRKERDVAALFLLDMSASTDDIIPDPQSDADETEITAQDMEDEDEFLSAFFSDRDNLQVETDKRRIIDLERESVVLMAEALQELGDNYSICGFSGYGRDQVDYYICKAFDERYDDDARSRIAAIKPCRSTRMGPAIRHACMQLGRTESRMKTLIIISDGYPQDYDYGRDRGSKEYGIQDTTKALAEARQKGIQTFCLTVDQSGHDYLRDMCPDNQYMVIRNLEQLPSELSRVYEGLTT